jgi:phytol kinase
MFPGNAEYSCVVLSIIALGDGAAALGGRWFGKTPLPWNADKTWAGLVCFLLVSIPVSGIVYWGEARPGVPFADAALCGVAAAVPAAVAETLRVRMNDNLRVGVAAAVGVVVASRLIFSGS